MKQVLLLAAFVVVCLLGSCDAACPCASCITRFAPPQYNDCNSTYPYVGHSLCCVGACPATLPIQVGGDCGRVSVRPDDEYSRIQVGVQVQLDINLLDYDDNYLSGANYSATLTTDDLSAVYGTSNTVSLSTSNPYVKVTFTNQRTTTVTITTTPRTTTFTYSFLVTSIPFSIYSGDVSMSGSNTDSTTAAAKAVDGDLSTYSTTGIGQYMYWTANAGSPPISVLRSVVVWNTQDPSLRASQNGFIVYLKATPFTGTTPTQLSTETGVVASAVQTGATRQCWIVNFPSTTTGVRYIRVMNTQSTSQPLSLAEVQAFTTLVTPYLQLTTASPTVAPKTIVSVNISSAITGYSWTDYTGTVTLSSSDSKTSLPKSVNLVNGQGSFTVVFPTAGTFTITATPTATSENGAFSTGTLVFSVTGTPGTATSNNNNSATTLFASTLSVLLVVILVIIA